MEERLTAAPLGLQAFCSTHPSFIHTSIHHPPTHLDLKQGFLCVLLLSELTHMPPTPNPDGLF